LPDRLCLLPARQQILILSEPSLTNIFRADTGSSA